MDLKIQRLHLRRHLYESLRRARRGPGRRALRRQLALLSAMPPPEDDGSAGVREPRRPLPPEGPASCALQLP